MCHPELGSLVSPVRLQKQHPAPRVSVPSLSNKVIILSLSSDWYPLNILMMHACFGFFSLVLYLVIKAVVFIWRSIDYVVNFLQICIILLNLLEMIIPHRGRVLV